MSKIIAKSPVFTQLYSSLNGLSTLRSHHYQTFFQEGFDNYQDIHTSAYFIFLALVCWFSIMMDLIFVIYVAVVTYACVLRFESNIYFRNLNPNLF